MSGQVRPLTDKEVEVIDSEYKQLMAKLEVQAVEQREFLKTNIARDTKLEPEFRDRLVTMLASGAGYIVRAFRVTDANALQKPHVQVTYDIDDDLYAYLKRPTSLLPRELRGFLDEGVDVTQHASQDAAVDTTPLIGKTRTGVPELDNIIRARK